tara:strand:+ start:2410 stop:3792 length:1383 start_codon:yes stop_codon:yes gene_type:complete
MKDKIALFIGPSMTEGIELGDNVTIFSPIKSGDIYKLMTHGYKKIGIVDGVFHGVPSIWHREILYAMERGIEIYGSSSMGALRAAEMDKLGVNGVGQVYEWYRSGDIIGDDEVALSHLPEYPYEATTIPLVDIRNILVNKLNIPIKSRIHSEVIEAIRTITYWHRTIHTLKGIFNEEGELMDICNSIIKYAPTMKSIKKIDAEVLIKKIQESPYKNLDTWKMNEKKPPSLTIDLYGDLAIKSRLDKNGQPYSFGEFTTIENNHKRSALVHSFLSYWLEDKDPYDIKSQTLIETKSDFANMTKYVEEICKKGLVKEEVRHFMYISNYFYSIIEKGRISLTNRLLRSAQTYLENNPAKDPIYGSFPQFDNKQANNRILTVLGYEIHLVEEAFEEYRLDIDNLLQLYTSIYTRTRIKDLEEGLQKYILMGTFGSSALGCVQNVLQAHICKFSTIYAYGSKKND